MEHREKTVGLSSHQIIMQDRKRIEMTGVEDVDSFDDTIVVAYTTLGELTVRGRGLQVRQLSVDSGSLSVEGDIESLSYADVHKGGFLSRLLR